MLNTLLGFEMVNVVDKMYALRLGGRKTGKQIMAQKRHNKIVINAMKS